MTDVAPLFRPFRIRGLTLKNRIVMAPMTRARSPGAFPNDDNVAYYARRAAGEVGLILSEGTLTRRKGALPTFRCSGENSRSQAGSV